AGISWVVAHGELVVANGRSGSACQAIEDVARSVAAGVEVSEIVGADWRRQVPVIGRLHLSNVAVRVYGLVRLLRSRVGLAWIGSCGGGADIAVSHRVLNPAIVILDLSDGPGQLAALILRYQ